MSRQWRWPLLAAFFALALGVCIIAELQQAKIYNQSQPAQADSTNKQTSNPPAKLSGQEHLDERDQENHWYDHLTEGLLVLFNGVLAAFTARLFYATDRQAREMQASINAAVRSADAAITSNQIAVTNAEQQLRAYVTAREIVGDPHRGFGYMGAHGPVEGNIRSFTLAVVLRNGGQTPAVKIRTNASIRYFENGLPAGFNFPDSTNFGHGVVGPKSEYHVTVGDITIEQIDIESHPGNWIVWGWVEYDDVFDGTPRHRTEFSFEIKRKRLPDMEIAMNFMPRQEYNAIDWDCARPFNPHENKYG